MFESSQNSSGSMGPLDLTMRGPGPILQGPHFFNIQLKANNHALCIHYYVLLSIDKDLYITQFFCYTVFIIKFPSLSSIMLLLVITSYANNNCH